MYDTRTPWLDNSCATTESIKKSHDILILVVEENFMCKLNHKKSIFIRSIIMPFDIRHQDSLLT